MKLSFDNEELKNRIMYFIKDNGRKPYLICSEETYELMSKTDEDELFARLMNMTDNLYPKTSNKDLPRNSFCGCLVFLDKSLPVGEVIIA